MIVSLNLVLGQFAASRAIHRNVTGYFVTGMQSDLIEALSKMLNFT